MLQEPGSFVFASFLTLSFFRSFALLWYVYTGIRSSSMETFKDYDKLKQDIMESRASLSRCFEQSRQRFGHQTNSMSQPGVNRGGMSSKKSFFGNILSAVKHVRASERGGGGGGGGGGVTRADSTFIYVGCLFSQKLYLRDFTNNNNASSHVFGYPSATSQRLIASCQREESSRVIATSRSMWVAAAKSHL